MKNLSVENIIKIVNGKYYGPDELLKKEISGVSTNSQTVEKDELFIPFVGEKVDAHRFIPMAIEKGALVSLSERKLELDVPYIQVESSHIALKELAKFYRDQIDAKIVAIVGSVGKTSTKEMIASILSTKYKVQKTMGNLNNEIGMPLTILSIRDEHDMAVVEMGISDFGEMTRLAEISRPDIVVMTNIGYCHLEQLGTRDGILKAKTEVIPFIKEGGVLILNGDDDKLSTIPKIDNLTVVRYGIEGVTEFEGSPVTKREDLFAMAKNLETGEGLGEKATFVYDNNEFSTIIPIPGEHNVLNALAGLTVGAIMGLSKEEIKTGIEAVQTISGRNNLIEINGVSIIDDCYNANPVSMKASIKVLSAAKGRKIAILGDMGELGTNEHELHYAVGAFMAKLKIDLVCITGELSRDIALGAIENGTDALICHFDSKEELVDYVKSEMKEGDTILVKASHFMQFEKIVEMLKK